MKPEASSLTKIACGRQQVEFEHFNFDITTTTNFETFVDRIEHGGRDGVSRVDLVLSCVDNYAARMAVNQASIATSLPSRLPKQDHST